MSAQDDMTPDEFARAFVRVSQWAHTVGPSQTSPFAPLLRQHFGTDPVAFPITSEALGPHERPNLQLALDEYLATRTVEIVGLTAPHDGMTASLGGMIHEWDHGFRVGPVRRTLVPLDAGRSLSCVMSALYLVADGDRRAAILLAPSETPYGATGIRLEAMAATTEESEGLVADLRALMRERDVFRGKTISLGSHGEMHGEGFAVTFVDVPAVARDDIVLPDGVLDTLELHTVTFAEHQATLAAGGRHIRRGLLLHGPPGTGKTLTCSYLIDRLPGRTVIILSGSGLGLVTAACTMARDLQPALVILEDVDLVAHERTYFDGGASSLLFELLNQMDGIGEDADVVFLMTTNRAQLLEPALAARPGRVDQAVEFPLPDADARLRLLKLFSRGLVVMLDDPDAIVARTEDVSPAFVRELVRKAALYAARDGTATVRDAHFGEALDQLDAGGRLTRSLLGTRREEEVPGAGDWTEDEEWDEP